MHDLRASHTATLLPDGKVLIVGGFKKVRTYDQVYFNSAELYDPQTRTFTVTGNLNIARCGHTATLLHDGTVLIVGGGNDAPLASVELYDPRTGSFKLLGEMSVPRQDHTATLLKDGNVLIFGGSQGENHSAEIFDTRTRRFKLTGVTAMGRVSNTATLLPDGRVLIAGGAIHVGSRREVLSSAEIYDPQKGTFVSTGRMTTIRYKHGAVLLPDSTVLIVGGSDERDWQGQYNTAELYDAKRGTFSRLADMKGKRFKLPDGVSLLKDGMALISGGSNQMEVYDLRKKGFSPVATLREPRFFATATPLADGSVLITGGYNTQPQSTDEAYVYKQ
jgi:hypothetical protein